MTCPLSPHESARVSRLGANKSAALRDGILAVRVVDIASFPVLYPVQADNRPATSRSPLAAARIAAFLYRRSLTVSRDLAI